MIDLFCVALSIIFIPLLVVGKHMINNSNEIKMELSETGGQEKIIGNTSYDKLDYKNIETRNIFSPDGLYKLPEAKEKLDNKGKLHDKIYRFIGVLESGQKSAVFIKEEGDIITLKTGDRLEDGAVISGIENLSVRLEKDNEVIEHRIFKLEDKSNAD